MFSGRKIADANSQQIEERLELAIIETGEAEMIATEAERKYRYPPPKFVNLGPKMAKILDFQGGRAFFLSSNTFIWASMGQSFTPALRVRPTGRETNFGPIDFLTENVPN